MRALQACGVISMCKTVLLHCSIGTLQHVQDTIVVLIHHINDMLGYVVHYYYMLNYVVLYSTLP